MDPADPHGAGSGLSALGLFAVLFSLALPMLAFFSVNVALGDIERDLDAGPAMLQLVVAGYGIPYASLVVLGGRLGDGFGRRNVMLVGLAGFVLTSVACALAQTGPQLVAGRVAQGVSAALTAPQVLATIHATLTDERRARAIGLFGATAGIGTSLAFLVGGGVVSLDVLGLGWRGVFWLNVPVGIAVALAVHRWVPNSRAAARPPVDVVGTVLLATAMVLFVGPLTEGRALGWPAWTWVSLAALLPVAGAFWWSQRRRERLGGLPLVPPSVLRERSMAVGLLVVAPFFTAFGGFMFVFALAAQDDAGMSAVQTGLALLPLALGFLTGSLVAPGLADRYGTRPMVQGALLSGLGYVAIAVGAGVAWPEFSMWHVLPGMVAVGLGNGLLIAPLFGIVLSGVPAAQAGQGSGMLITTQQMAIGLGSALVGALFLSLGVDHGNAMPFVVTVLVVACGLLLTTVLTPRLAPRR